MNRSRLGALIGLCGLAMWAGLDLRPAAARNAPNASEVGTQIQSQSPVKTTAYDSKPPTTRNAAGRYFVEFRSRYALSYGHTFAVHGRLNTRGGIATSEVAGLHPAGDDPTPWVVGHLIPVPSETGPSDGDLDEKYVSARYRVTLTEAEYTRVAAYIRQLQATSPAWHAVYYNCNAFVADIARFMGLQTPSSTLLYPADFINRLRELNDGPRRHAAATPRSAAE